MLVDGGDQAGEEHEEAQVVLGVRTGLEEVLAVGRERPVVVLARAVDILEGLLVLQARESVVARQQLHLLHGEQVVVHRRRARLKDWRQFVLARGHLVVLGLRGDAQLPQLVVELLHEFSYGGPDGAEVMLLQLLPLGRRAAKERTTGENEVRTGLVVLLLDKEVLLLGADGGKDALGLATKQGKDALGLHLECVLRAQERGLLVERLARVGDEGRGDAEHLVLDEGGAHGIPHGVAARLKGRTEAAGREARGVRLAANELLARESHENRAVSLGREEAVVLLARDARQRLEPVGKVRGALLQRPLLHSVGDLVGNAQIERRPLVDDAP